MIRSSSSSSSSSSFRLGGKHTTVLLLLACCLVSHHVVHVVSSSQNNDNQNEKEHRHNGDDINEHQPQHLQPHVATTENQVIRHGKNDGATTLAHHHQHRQQQYKLAQDESNTLLHNLWSKLLNKFDVSVNKGQQRQQQHQDQQKDPFAEQLVKLKPSKPKTWRYHRPSNSRASRRRLLYESTLYEHYEHYLPLLVEAEEEEEEAKEEERNSLPSPRNVKENIKKASWIAEQLQLYIDKQNSYTTTKYDNNEKHCLWYNAGRNAYWTYKWCPQQSIQQFHLQPYIVTRNQEEDELGWQLESMTSLGHYYSSNENDSSTGNTDRIDNVWKQKIMRVNEHINHKAGKNVNANQNDENSKSIGNSHRNNHNSSNKEGKLQFYYHGDKCIPPETTIKQVQQYQERRAVVRATYGCPPSLFSTGNSNQQMTIYLIDEPQLCEYIIHVCYQYHSTEEQRNDENQKDNDNVATTKRSDHDDDDFVLVVEGPNDDTAFTLRKKNSTNDKISNEASSVLKKSKDMNTEDIDSEDDSDGSTDNNSVKGEGDQDEEEDEEEEEDGHAFLEDIEHVLDTYLYQSGIDVQISEAADHHHHRTTPLHIGLPPIPPSRVRENRKLIHHMFTHAYDSYMYNAFPASEIKPLSCEGGAFNLVKLPALTLIDALDTLAIMGNYTEFARSVERIRTLHETMKHQQQEQEETIDEQFSFMNDEQLDNEDNDDWYDNDRTKQHRKQVHNDDENRHNHGNTGDGDGEEEVATPTTSYIDSGGLFAVNQNVSLFETNIRVLGGLLSAHQLAVAFMKDEVPKQDVWDKYGHVLIGEVPTSIMFKLEDDDHHHHINDPQENGNNDNDADQKVIVDHNSCSSKPIPDKEIVDTLLGKVGTPSTDAVPDSNVEVRTDENGKHQLDEMFKKQQASKNTTKTQKEKNRFAEYYEYDGILLELARDLGHRLLAAFDTKTGIPYGTVNLLYGVPPGETTIASLAGAGTLTLEMELLSRMTGDESFGKAAKLATRALWMRRSPELNLMGKHIDVHTGQWTETLSGIGSNSDSFYEYLIKHYVLFPEDEDFWTMLVAVYNGVHSDTRLGEWYADVDMNVGINKGRDGRRVFESLMAFYPGMQVLLGELSPAARTLNSFFMVREFLGFLPERFNYGSWKVDGGGGGVHPLRPELLESCYFLHRATIGLGLEKTRNNSDDDSYSHDSPLSGWLWAADFALHTLEDLTRVKCGYATVKDLSPRSTGSIPLGTQDPVRLVNEMPSFFLSETLKYLYLAFDDDNVLHTDTEREWVFTTEAHPIHHEPIVVRAEEKTKETRINELKRRLKLRLKDRIEIRNDQIFTSYIEHQSENGFCETEKWAENSPHHFFLDHLTKTKSATAGIKEEKRLSSNALGHAKLNLQVLKPLHLGGNTIDGEGWERDNLSHMAFDNQGMGDGYALHKSCINFHNSDLLWVRALNGGDVDYSELYVSTASNHEDPKDASKSWMMSALMAASSYNSGVYHGTGDEQAHCKIKKDPPPTKPSVLTNMADILYPDIAKYYSSSQIHRVNPDNGPNEFDIAGFGDRNGFFVRHVNSGEAVVTTMFGDTSSDGRSTAISCILIQLFRPIPKEANKKDDVSAVVPSKPEPKSQKSGVNWRTIFTTSNKKEPEETPESTFDMKRSLVIADTNGQSYMCELSILKRAVQSFDEEDVEEDETLGTYPCSPGLFGLSSLDQLRNMGGIEIEGKLKLPIPGNEYGCKEVLPTNSSHEDTSDKTVQLVRRGKCSFEDKVENQKHAKFVIVVNSDNDVFLMSSSVMEADDSNTEQDDNLGVMVVSRDGADIFEKYNDILSSSIIPEVIDNSNESKDENTIYAALSIMPQNGYADGTGKLEAGEDGKIDWPIVKSNERLLQIYAPGSWGIQGVGGFLDRKTGENTDYQLFLLTHNLASNSL